jgi:lauroyl/myristoyl acyltransferase
VGTLGHIARLADAAVDSIAKLISPLAPRRVHPGRRACLALEDISFSRTTADARLAAAILAARWRSALLLTQARQLSAAKLQRFLDSQVRFEGDTAFARTLATPRPVILATPHSGASLIACLAAVRRFRRERHFGVLYQHTARNAGIPAMFQRAGAKATLLSGVGGVVRALEILQHGGCIATMPDVFDEIIETLAVPFFGRWLRVAAGPALLAQRSGGLILPGYVITERGPAVCARVNEPIDSRDFDSGDARQDIFALTCRMFAELERRLLQAPEHWLYWDKLPRVSTPLECAAGVELSDLAGALARRCRAFPGLLHRVPELAPLLPGTPT